MRQRCALARTFALDSAVFLMDEPFGALDVQTKIQLEDVLLNLWSSAGRTVLFVTHDLGEAVALSIRNGNVEWEAGIVAAFFRLQRAEDALRKAEEAGRSRSKGEDPAIKKGSTPPGTSGNK